MNKRTSKRKVKAASQVVVNTCGDINCGLAHIWLLDEHEITYAVAALEKSTALGVVLDLCTTAGISYDELTHAAARRMGN